MEPGTALESWANMWRSGRADLASTRVSTSTSFTDNIFTARCRVREARCLSPPTPRSSTDTRTGTITASVGVRLPNMSLHGRRPAPPSPLAWSVLQENLSPTEQSESCKVRQQLLLQPILDFATWSAPNAGDVLLRYILRREATMWSHEGTCCVWATVHSLLALQRKQFRPPAQPHSIKDVQPFKKRNEGTRSGETMATVFSDPPQFDLESRHALSFSFFVIKLGKYSTWSPQFQILSAWNSCPKIMTLSMGRVVA